MDRDERLPNFDLHASSLFDDIDDDNHDRNNPLMEITRYSTPTAQEYHIEEISVRRMPVTTNELQDIIIPPSTPSRPLFTNQRATTTREIEIIDLVTPTKASNSFFEPDYIPRTLHFYNRHRLSILPMFPSASSNDTKNDANNTTLNLLLTNVAPIELSRSELIHRQPGQYPCIFTMTDPKSFNTSSLMYNYYQNYFLSISDRLNVDISVLDHNYARLQAFLELFRQRRAQMLHANKRLEDTFYLHDCELPQLLEFYLQMDVDLFYMKTCSFRNAQPRSKIEGIFCSKIPECHYKMTPCGQCSLCQTSVDMRYRQQAPVLFNRREKHRFVNGYESILNCPVTCNTRNIIYVLTCLCGQYDYISETSYTLASRLEYHYQIASYAICKLLLGEKNMKRLSTYQESGLSMNKENMLLYQHPKQCSATIQAFLDVNQHFWPFVPMKNDEVDADNAHYQRMHTTTTMLNSPQDATVQKYLNDLPKAPDGYTFSIRQIQKQIDFFRKNFAHTKIFTQVPLYNATIIAVLPLDTSDLFRQIVHSLFVTHTEAKLNTLGHLFNLDTKTNTNLKPDIWCANLVRRLI